MFLIPPSTWIRAALRRRTVATLMAGGLCMLVGSFGFVSGASAEDGMKITSPTRLFAPNEEWRARGLAYVDLPLRIRARFDTSYRHHGTRSDRLASPLVSSVGPAILSDQSLESRISFTRPIFERIELEVAWQTRNRLTSGDPMGFGRQIVGAFIRVTP